MAKIMLTSIAFIYYLLTFPQSLLLNGLMPCSHFPLLLHFPLFHQLYYQNIIVDWKFQYCINRYLYPPCNHIEKMIQCSYSKTSFNRFKNEYFMPFHKTIRKRRNDSRQLIIIQIPIVNTSVKC
jgi:hypothetical protein